MSKFDLSDYEMRVRSVRCTLCQAGSGTNCRSERGEEMRPHVARMDAYERLRAQNTERRDPELHDTDTREDLDNNL